MLQRDKRQDDTDALLRQSLAEALALTDERVAAFDLSTPLFGVLPELDSMAVATLLTDMEDRLGIVVDDDEIDAQVFETFGQLLAYAKAKRTEI